MIATQIRIWGGSELTPGCEKYPRSRRVGVQTASSHEAFRSSYEDPIKSRYRDARLLLYFRRCLIGGGLGWLARMPRTSTERNTRTGTFFLGRPSRRFMTEWQQQGLRVQRGHVEGLRASSARAENPPFSSSPCRLLPRERPPCRLSSSFPASSAPRKEHSTSIRWSPVSHGVDFHIQTEEIS